MNNYFLSNDVHGIKAKLNIYYDYDYNQEDNYYEIYIAFKKYADVGLDTYEAISDPAQCGAFDFNEYKNKEYLEFGACMQAYDASEFIEMGYEFAGDINTLIAKLCKYGYNMIRSSKGRRM